MLKEKYTCIWVFDFIELFSKSSTSPDLSEQGSRFSDCNIPGTNFELEEAQTSSKGLEYIKKRISDDTLNQITICS